MFEKGKQLWTKVYSEVFSKEVQEDTPKVELGSFGDCICDVSPPLEDDKVSIQADIPRANPWSLRWGSIFTSIYYTTHFFPDWKSYALHLESSLKEMESLYKTSLRELVTVDKALAAEKHKQRLKVAHPETGKKVSTVECLISYKVLVEELRRENKFLMDELLELRKEIKKDS